MLRCYAVDDEELCIASLVRLLGTSTKAKVIGTATDPLEAIPSIEALHPDALFLDIHMPEIDGFTLLRQLRWQPLVVFTTAYDQHAIRAFEVNSVDYLLKPITKARLEHTIERLCQRKNQHPAELRSVLENLARSLQPKVYLQRVSAQAGESHVIVPVEDISHFAAEGRCTVAFTERGRFLLNNSLGELEDRLDPARFSRIHRSAIVNLECVASMSRWFGGRLILRLKDNKRTELTVSRARASRLHDALGL